MVFLDVYHEIGREIEINYIFEFMMLWVKFIFKNHMGPRVDFIDFSSGVDNYYKLLNYTHWSIF